MKKLLIIFTSVTLALVSCKNQTDGLASSNNADDVYYNPAKDRKPNVPSQPEQYVAQNQQQYDPNAGKIAATAADKNNPYYKDPNFNYDDYYDNAYAARIRRFNNPLYGTGYYDSYNTNSYFYNGNPSMYGNSIYNSYNMGYGSSMYGNGGYGYYSPSNSFWNSYYNPYYNGFGNSMGYGMGYGSGLSIGYGMGYGSGMGYGYNPYSMCNMGYGYGGYNPYMYGMGYSPYGYSPYGYGMGYGYASPMNYGGYYNSYDFNSNSYSHNGPRGTHSGGNSTTTSPMPAPHHMMINQPSVQGPPSSSPYNTERFNQVSIPKENYTKIVEAKNPVNNPMYAPVNTQQNGGGGRPIYNNGGTTNGGYNTGGYTNQGGTYNYNTPRGNGTTQPTNTGGETRPHKWFSTGGTTGDNTNGGYNNNNGGYNNTPATGKWGGGFGGSSGGGYGGGSSGGSTGGGGGGISRPHR
ncbi:MAG TPA: hypothetical protein VNZ49_13195 [Bacteroidia bacterium]|jgi:hypothetical protein|nr:hypothetical protein [Bacteroidia bacterium]